MNRWVRRALLTGCIAALLFVLAWVWWRNSDLRTFLYGQDARGRLGGVRMGLEAYWAANEHPPEQQFWKEAVVEYSVHESGQSVFKSREALQNCFAVVFAESPWEFNGSSSAFRRRGDPPIAVCDPDARVRESSSTTASIDDSGSLGIYNSHGNRIGGLPPEAIIFTLYLSRRIVRQTVADLDQRRNLDAVKEF